MILKFLIILAFLTQVGCLSRKTFGNGASVFQNSLNKLFEIPQKFLPNPGFQPETLMNVTQIIRHHGYPAEEHTVVTEDGYILLIQRIPAQKSQNVNPELPPILLMHGYFGYSGNFVSNTPENAPAFLLAKAGFDVWLVNQRGTEYSRSHTSLNPNSADYWKFSWDEVAAFDLPACIDRMLNVTGHKQIYYAGHSLGGALPFALLATRPEYMSKVKTIYVFAPMVYMVNVTMPFKYYAQLVPIFQKLSKLIGYYEWPKYSPKLMGSLGKNFDPLFRSLAFFNYGDDYEQWNSSRTEVNAAHIFSSTPMNIYYHVLQAIKNPGFRKFDWGEQINRKKYGQRNPPDYNISGITIPTHIFYGDNDSFASINNAQFLMERLKNATMKAAGKHWNHVDFLWAKNAGKEFYNDLIAEMTRN